MHAFPKSLAFVRMHENLLHIACVSQTGVTVSIWPMVCNITNMHWLLLPQSQACGLSNTTLLLICVSWRLLWTTSQQCTTCMGSRCYTLQDLAVHTTRIVHLQAGCSGTASTKILHLYQAEITEATACDDTPDRLVSSLDCWLL